VQEEAAKQQELAMRDYLSKVERLQRVGMPILTAAVPMCEDNVAWWVGIHTATLEDFPKEKRDAARSVLDLAPTGLHVIHVVENSPAAEAGMEVGDRILKANEYVPGIEGKVTERFSEAVREQTRDGKPVSFVVSRAGSEQVVTVQPVQICDYPLNVVEMDDINAFADGKAIYVTTGMMRFAETDAELATVVGHELAHNAMGHITAQRINAIPGLALDILAALVGVNTQGAFSNMTARAFSKEFESEADYVGLYAMALSGATLDTSVADFWRRMGMAHPGAIKNVFNASHPATPERYLHLEQTVTEIAEKKSRGAPLMPDLKD
jgi:predicted Zn-dependent protease